MKTTWSAAYVDTRYRRPWEWRKTKKAELEARTGVLWTVDVSYGRYNFLPQFEARRVDARDAFPGDDDKIKAVLDEAPFSQSCGYVHFLKLAERTGMSLVRIMAAVWVLWQKQAVLFTVNRMGDAVAVRNR